MKFSFAAASVSLVTVLAALTTSAIARADDTTATSASTSDVAPKKAVKKKAKKKKKAAPVTPATEVAASEPAPAMVPDPQPAAPAEPAKPTPSVGTSTTPGADKPAEDRTATNAAKDKPFSAAPLVGYGTEGLHIGIGARAGYNIQAGLGSVYVGAAFVYHFGTSTETTIGGQTIGASASAFYPSLEGGYELRPIDRLAIRPYAGVGVIFATVSMKGLGGVDSSASSNAFAFYPGCAITYDIPEAPIFVGGDIRLLVPVEHGGEASLAMFITGGVRF